ncbi:MAG: glycogen/starch synthase [Elusimicrobia bacterium]|nr:glycogen/starch synthase [Elusimicrobiota bacterium]
MPGKKKLRVALCSWETGRAGEGLGVKVGGLGQVVEELPPELILAAARQGLALEVETLSPCFAHYDRSRLRKLPLRVPAAIEGHAFEFDVYEHRFLESVESPDETTAEVGFKSVYFWDEGQLHWTKADAVYPHDPWLGLKMYSAVAQAMAGYIRQGGFQTVHLHDYHVGLVPFFLGDGFLRRVPAHLTIHNASYQGVTPLQGGGYATLDRVGLPGEKLFHKYFDFFDNVNLLKGCMLKVAEHGGRVTTVSGDLAGSWGYAAELQESHAALLERARRIAGREPGRVFLPNRHLDVLEKLPVAGITNGLRRRHRPESMPEIDCVHLREESDRLKARYGSGVRLFGSDEVEREMLARDHRFDAGRLEVKAELKRLLHLEVFGRPAPPGDPCDLRHRARGEHPRPAPPGGPCALRHRARGEHPRPARGAPAVFGVVGRLVEQKNLGLVADIADRVLGHDAMARFVVLASAPLDDAWARGVEGRFRDLAGRHPGRVCFNNGFDPCLGKLILAGSDFILLPSRFEPCGLVDYEAALLGTIPVGRATGGLTKTRHCAYLYEWQDVADPGGEAEAFLAKIKEALGVFREDHPRHQALMRSAMATDTDWGPSAAQYVDLYRYGLLARDWAAVRRGSPEEFAASLGPDRELFARFFAPALAEYGHPFDRELARLLGEVL